MMKHCKRRNVSVDLSDESRNLSHRARNIQPSATLAITALVAELQRQT